MKRLCIRHALTLGLLATGIVTALVTVGAHAELSSVSAKAARAYCVCTPTDAGEASPLRDLVQFRTDGEGRTIIKSLGQKRNCEAEILRRKKACGIEAS